MGICSFTSRCRLLGAAEGGREPKARVEATLPRPEWLQRRLRLLHLPTGGETPEYCCSGLPLLGFAFVRQGTVWEGPLTEVSREFDLQRHCFADPSDAFSLRVEAVFRLREAVGLYLAYPGGGAPGSGGRAPERARASAQCVQLPSMRNMAFVPVLPCSLDLGSMAGERMSLAGGARGHDTAANVLRCAGQTMHELVCLSVLAPVAELVIHGEWRDIVWLARWTFPRLLFENWPKLHAREGLHENRDPGNTAWGSTEQTLSTVLRHLRVWAPDIIAAAQAQDGEEGGAGTCLTLTSMVAKVEDMLRSFRGESRTRCWSWRVRASRWAAMELIRCVLLISQGQTMSNLELHAMHMCNLLLPGMECPDLHARALQLPRLPSVSTMRRARLQVDVAMMLAKRMASVCSESGISPVWYYGHVDASPQGGREWLVAQRFEILDQDILDVFAAFRVLCEMHVREDGARAGDEDDSDDRDGGERRVEEARAQNNLVLSERTRTHTNVPVSLGLRRAQLPLKAAAFLHSLGLETLNLDAALRSYVSLTTDMGTEMLLPDFHMGGAPQSGMPDWSDVAPLEMVFGDDAGGAGGGAPDGAAQAAQGQLTSHAITVPGLLHIVDNMLHDVDTKLRWWPEFWRQSKNLERLLADNLRRSRFQAKCIEGGPFEEYSRMFKTWSATLYEHRWGSTLAFFREVAGGLARAQGHMERRKIRA